MNLPTSLAAALAVLLVAASPAAASEPVASFTYAPAAPAVGENVLFESTSTPDPANTSPLSLAWDLDGDGAFDDAEGSRATRKFEAGAHVVRLRARQGTGHENVAEKTIQVGPVETPPTPTPTATPSTPESTPTATPVPNQPPVAKIATGCVAGGVCSGLSAREEQPHTFDATPSGDPDGQITKYEWDLDGIAGYEKTGGPTLTHTYARHQLVETGKRTVRLRVTDDKGATAEAELTLTLLQASCQSQFTTGRLKMTGVCLRFSKGRWYTGQPLAINGIKIAPKPNRTVTMNVPAGEISSNGATVAVDVKGVPVTLVDGAFHWGFDDDIHLTGFALSPNAKLNGLKITGLEPAPQLGTGGTAKLGLRVALPSQFGGATSDAPIPVTTGGASAASEPLTFGVRDAAIGPIGLDHLTVSFDGQDLWQISAGVKLPPPIPYTIEGDAGIRGGAFEHAGAAVSFGTPGIGPLGPVFLQRISFRVEVNPKKSKCVPHTGVEVLDQRQLLHDITGRWYDVPDLKLDYGSPTFALCGEVGLTGGPTVLGVAAVRLDAGLGLATYDDRPAVFRAFGTVKLVEIPLADAALELHTNGYTRMHAKFNWGISGLATLKGFLQFEMMAPKFNAEAHVDACLEFIDWCAGARALVSSKGVAVCLKIDVLVDDWEPGFGYRWGELLPTLYFAGCDVGSYREHISSGGAVKVSAAAVEHEHTIDFPAGLPGATIVARGNGAPPKLTLVGPNGERITTPEDLRPATAPGSLVMKDPRANLTQFAISKPSAGRWRVVVEDGSAPVVSLKSAEGLTRPEIGASVSGHGQRRMLDYEVEPGLKVTFFERGASTGRKIGEARNTEGRIDFTPAPGAAEKRQIIAVVEGRGEYEVNDYWAPAAEQPGRVRALKLTRTRVSWRDGGKHEVRVSYAGGRRVVKRTSAHSLALHGRVVSVRVRAVTDTGLAGPFTTKRARAMR